MTKPYGSSLPPALWAINEEAGPSRPSSRTSSRIRRARSHENSAAGRPPRASRGATRGLGRPRSAGEGPPQTAQDVQEGRWTSPQSPGARRSRPRPTPQDPVNPSREVPAAPGGPRRVPQRPSARRSPALTGHSHTIPREAHPPGRIGASPGSRPGRDLPADGKPDRQAASSGAAPAMVRSVRSRGRS